MRKILSIIKEWSAVMVLSVILACMVCAFVCCLVCGGKVYPILGAIAVALNIAVIVWQTAIEVKSRIGGS